MSYSAIVATLVLTLAALISFCVTYGKPLSVKPADVRFVPIVNEAPSRASHAASPAEQIRR